MTTTLHPTETTGIPGSLDTEQLRAALDAMLATCAELDPDLLHSRTAAGRAVLALAGAARESAGALGVDPGTCLTHGPGVVVVRDFVAAVRLFDRAVPRD